jgi:hypothetical protein
MIALLVMISFEELKAIHVRKKRVRRLMKPECREPEDLVGDFLGFLIGELVFNREEVGMRF